MKKLACLFLAAVLLAPTLRAQSPTPTPTPAPLAGPIQFTTLPPASSSLPTAGGFNQVSLTLGVGQYITGDANNNPVVATFPTVPTLHAGTSTATTASLTRTITFPAMPSLNYSIWVTPSTGIGALQITYSNKTLTSFVVNFSASTSAACDWGVVGNQ